MFKITSRFYVIYGDDIPIYVGYTNRTVKQRFKEHKEDKDFSEYEDVHVEELNKEKLVYFFTWNYEQTCKNADEVSLREGQLVQEYGTQNSIYQKAVGGGQTWASEKWFVKSNKNNPKFLGMSTSDIKRLLDRDKLVSTWLSSFIGGQRPNKEVWLLNFVSHQLPRKKVWLLNFVNDQIPHKELWLKNFVKNQKITRKTWLNSFVNGQIPYNEVWLKSFVSTQIPKKELWLKNFVNNQRPSKENWLRDFVGNQYPNQELWLKSFVSSQKAKTL